MIDSCLKEEGGQEYVCFLFKSLHSISPFQPTFLSFQQMRDQAQKELKQLREDLMEKKINVTLTKSQKSLQTLISPENIPV